MAPLAVRVMRSAKARPRSSTLAPFNAMVAAEVSPKRFTAAVAVAFSAPVAVICDAVPPLMVVPLSVIAEPVITPE